MRWLALVLSMMSLIAACGGGGTGSADGAADSAGQACATAAANATCAGEGTICGAEACTDVCQFCNLLRCTSGRWQAMESAPAPCFACGPDGRCQTGAAYCDVIIGGVAGSPPSYRCTEIPAACRSTPTCACLQSQSIAGSCAQVGAGALTVTLAAP